MSEDKEFHIGRSFHGHFLEDECPCPKAECGLVIRDKTDPMCEQHTVRSAKAIRQSHELKYCPGSMKVEKN